MRKTLRNILLTTAILTGLSVGCDKTQINSPQANIPQIMRNDEKLIYHSIDEVNGNKWEVYKYDSGKERYGTYGLINGNLNYYFGDGQWDSVEGKLSSDPWLRELKKEMKEKMKRGYISVEGLNN